MKNYRFDLYFSYWIFAWLILSFIFKKAISPPFYLLIAAFIINIIYVIFNCSQDKDYKNLHLVIAFVTLLLKISGIILVYYTKRYNIYNELIIGISLLIIYIIYKYFYYKIDYSKEFSNQENNEIGYYNCTNTPLYNFINTYIKYDE